MWRYRLYSCDGDQTSAADYCRGLIRAIMERDVPALPTDWEIGLVRRSW
jgi:hypothetical protein